MGLKDLTTGSAQLGDKIIAEANKSSASIDRRVHGDWDFPFSSQKSGNNTSVYLEWKADYEIIKNPSRTIGIPLPQITSTRPSNCEIFDLVSRVSSWHDTIKSESKKTAENLKGNKIFKSAERKNNFEVEKIGRKTYVDCNHTRLILNWNQKDSDSIHVDPNKND